MHEPAAVDGIGQRPVHRAGVVPDEQITHLPLVAVHVLRLGGPITKVRKQSPAVLDRVSDDVVRGCAQQQ